MHILLSFACFKLFFLKEASHSVPHTVLLVCDKIKVWFFTFIPNIPIAYTWMHFFLNSVYLVSAEFCSTYRWLQKFIGQDPAIQKFIIWGRGEERRPTYTEECSLRVIREKSRWETSIAVPSQHLLEQRCCSKPLSPEEMPQCCKPCLSRRTSKLPWRHWHHPQVCTKSGNLSKEMFSGAGYSSVCLEVLPPEWHVICSTVSGCSVAKLFILLFFQVNRWKCGKWKCYLLCLVWLSATPWSPACWAPLPWDSPGRNTGVRCHSLCQGFVPFQGSNPGVLPYRQILQHLSHQGSPLIGETDYQKNKWSTDCVHKHYHTSA